MTGHLGTFVGGTTALVGNVISIEPSEESVADIATPYLGLAKGSGVPYEPGELVEGGEYTIELEDLGQSHHVDKDSSATGTGVAKILRTVQTFTWTKPPASGMTNGATRAFSGYAKSVKENVAVTGTRSTITIKVKVAGTITKTASTSS